MAKQQKTKGRHAKIILWSVVTIMLGATLLPLTGYIYVGVTSASAQATEESNPRANYWRAVREGGAGYVASQGPYTTNTLIQNGGQNWRQIRNGPVSTYTPWLLAAVIGAILIFHLVRGRIKVTEPRSGRMVERWGMGERVLHWYTAILFIILAITGLSMLFGRTVLIPLLGPEGFAAWASVARLAHNYLGPFFAVGILIEIVWWIRHNIPNATDMKWFAQGGGILTNTHPPAGRMNGGEKLWFWIICTFGVAVVVTGIILDFPNFEQSRETMQLVNIIHTVAAMVWIAVAIGHIWIGTLGSEGSLEGMTTGRVSEEWARQHHDEWLEQVKSREQS
ncbi:MAG: formate dehydrogenase subunit gamma [Arenicellales bacterium]|nr:formate dehydrogenase subunit gamma [Arenicellales bacterium]